MLYVAHMASTSSIKSKVVHYTRVAHNAVRDAHYHQNERSSKWPRVEHEFLRKNPACAACGSIQHLNVHHKVPFHLDPKLELDEMNLITLCMSEGKHCHLLIGHGDSFKAYVPDVVALSSQIMVAYNANDIEKAASIIQQARDARRTEL